MSLKSWQRRGFFNEISLELQIFPFSKAARKLFTTLFSPNILRKSPANTQLAISYGQQVTFAEKEVDYYKMKLIIDISYWEGGELNPQYQCEISSAIAIPRGLD